jgi:competence protein ComEA
VVPLTKYEKYILLFLVVTAFLGTALLHYKKTSPGTPDRTTLFPSRPQRLAIININTATEQELMALKGIGPALAARIVAYRRDRGYFVSKEDLQKVRGIGPATLKAIEEMITVK